MIPDSRPQPRYARQFVRATAVLGAALLTVTVVSAIRSGFGASAAGANGGPLQVLVPPGQPTAGQPLNSGGSGTAFALAPPTGAACTGDSATGGYRVQSYMVPSSVDPSTLTFDANGPIPAGIGANLRLPLFGSAGGSPFVQQTTAVATTPGGGGLLVNLPSFSFAVFAPDGPSFVPAGTYNLGFACTLGNASPTQQDKFWNVQMTFSVAPNDLPAGITWIVGTPPPPTTTTTSTTTTSTTTTTLPATTTSTTTTTVPATTTSTTTTTLPATTTSTTTTTLPATTTSTTTTTVPATTTSTTTTTVPPTTTSSTTTTTVPATTSTTTTVPGTTTTTVEDADEGENENECEHRNRGHHSHPRSECHPHRGRGHSSKHGLSMWIRRS